MKVLVSNNPNEAKDIYELRRIRKNIKGACELASIPYVSTPLLDYDILHVIDLNEDLVINDAVDRNKKVVISALMAESDPSGKMCKHDRKGTHLKPKALKTLNQVDLVLVPNQPCKEFLIKEGVKKNIEVLPSGVNMSRFSAINDIEKTLFRKYFGISNAHICLCVGQYDDDKEKNKVIEIAKKCPNITFVYIGPKKNYGIFDWLFNKIIRKAPKNVIFSDIIEDDVYRSAMVNSEIYLSLKDIKFDSVTMLEAMASKTRVISFNDTITPNDYDKHIECYINVDDVVAAIKENVEHPKEKELSSAYEFARSRNLKEISKKLKEYYEQLLK